MRRSGKRGFSSGRIPWRTLVVLLAIFAISASVATRTFHGFYCNQPNAHSVQSDAKRQHLDADAFQLKDPICQIATMLLPVPAPHAPPEEPQIRTVDLAESLYNRPPPSISLL
jgi:hypothetical protein